MSRLIAILARNSVPLAAALLAASTWLCSHQPLTANHPSLVRPPLWPATIAVPFMIFGPGTHRKAAINRRLGD